MYITYSFILTKTPMRITLAGGGTDVLWYSKQRGGAWISAAINKYIYITVCKSPNPKRITISFQDKTAIATSLSTVPNDIIRECLSSTGVSNGIEIYISSETPSRSGLGGSGALEVGLLHALHRYKNESITQLQLAKEATSIEIDHLHKPVGPQDQYITSIGNIHYFEIDKSGYIVIERLQIPPRALKLLENNLLYFSTGIQRNSSYILSDEKSEGRKDKRIIETLDEIKKLGYHIKKSLLKGKIDDFGHSLHTHWLLKKKLSFRVSNPIIDKWYNEAMKFGALGGKVMGAGGGGWFMFYVKSGKSAFRRHMLQLGLQEQHVRFDMEGTKVL